MDGFLLVHKPIGWTSHDVVAKSRRLLNTREIGHLGTLDPFAEGLLVLAIGAATKCLPFMMEWSKVYRATLKLGSSTDTGDLTGVVTESKPVPTLTEPMISQAIAHFTGVQTQIPPMYSAKKVDGKKLVNLARAGKVIDREPISITIAHLSLHLFDAHTLGIEAEVSTGTYIRTLGEDIARYLGTVGHLTQLTRVSSGPLMLSNAFQIDDLHPEMPLLSIELGLSHLPLLVIKEEALLAKIRNGMSVKLPSHAPLILLASATHLHAIYERKDDGYYHSRRGLGAIPR